MNLATFFQRWSHLHHVSANSSHLHVTQIVLREDHQYKGFKARLVSTQMSWKQPAKNFPYATVV